MRTPRQVTLRAVTLAASIAWRQIADEPVRAVLLAWGVLPRPARTLVGMAGPYGRAAALWGAGERAAALAVLDRSPRRLAAFGLAVDQPRVTRSALERLPGTNRRHPRLAAGLAWREGRLSDAISALDGARGRRARRLRRTLLAQRAVLDRRWTRPKAGNTEAIPGRVLHVVTDALPATSAGYTIRTHEIVRAQQRAGLDPHVLTGPGFPVTKGVLDGRRLAVLDGIPYHRLLPWTVLPWTLPQRDMAVELTGRLKPWILHPASNYANAQIALDLRDRFGIPVVYEVRGFWEDTWLSRHPADGEALAASELYQAIRAAETSCMRAADLVVTLGEAMRAEIVSRGIDDDKVLIVPNAVAPEFLRPLAQQPHPGEYVVGTVTSLVPHEGIGTLLQATGLLRERGILVRALIVGDGPERAALQRQAAAAGVPADFTGHVPAARVRDFHALLDVFVVPRTGDRVCQLVTPLKPVEAMASGLCVVTSELTALAEIVKHGVTGALTLPQDPVSLADCLEWLFYSPDIRAKLGAAAREWVAGDRTWARNAARYREAYARLRE